MTNTHNEKQDTNETQYADENDVTSDTDTESRGSHILSVLGLLLKGTARDIVNETKKRIESMKNMIVVMLVAPIVCLVVGVTIAANSETISGVNTGRGFIIGGTFLATLLCGIILLRARVYAFAFVGVSRAARLMLGMSPSHTPPEVQKYTVYFYGIMAWVAGVCIYAQVVEIWRSIGTSLVVATVMMGLAAIMAARWFSGRLAQKALIVLMLGTLVISTIRLKSPRFLHMMDDAGDYAFGTDGRTDADRALLKKFNEELLTIRNNAATGKNDAGAECGGKYCNEGDVAKVKELENNIHLLETGQYWDKAAAPAPVTTVAAPAKTEAVPAKTAPTPPKADQKPQTRPASKAAATEGSKDSDPFATLDQFPDVQPVE